MRTLPRNTFVSLAILLGIFFQFFSPLIAHAEYERGEGTGLEEVAFPASIPETPIIRSSTHPDPNKWYSSEQARFEWDLPSGVTAIKASLTKGSSDQPDRLYRNGLAEIGIGDLEEGIWYFHLQLANLIGWSKTAHFRIQADLTPPENVVVKEIARADSTDPDLRFSITGTDNISGIDRVIAHFDHAETALQKHPSNSDIFILPNVAPGYGELILQVMDEAGNIYPVTRDYHVDPLETPVLKDYPTQVKKKENLFISGHTKYPDAMVEIQITDQNGSTQSFSIPSSEDGNFSITIPQEYMDGSYSISAIVHDKRGARSLKTDAATFTISSPLWSSILLPGVILIASLVILLGTLLWRENAPKRAAQKQNKERILEIKQELAKRDVRKAKGLVKQTLPRGQKTTEELLEELRHLQE